jgi:N4-(beta-N-acetylglucosaminyl)-L-asparaginase
MSRAIDRREMLGTAAAAASFACATTRSAQVAAAGERDAAPRAREGYPVMVGSANALAGMRDFYAMLSGGSDPLDAAIEVVKVVEKDPEDTSVGLGGLPNEEGVVQLDAAVMHGPTHNSGAVACLENILHPSEVARLVMERTDHCLIVGEGAYRFARAHGFEHVELLTDETRREWLRWKESLSPEDDWLAPPAATEGARGKTKTSWELKNRRLERTLARVRALEALGHDHAWGTIHCSALSVRGEVACVTTTSGLAFKIPGRVGDSPIVGAGLYCDQEAGSAGSTGRGEASILSNGSFAIVDELRRGASPLDAGIEVLRRIARQVERQAKWQPALLGADGKPAFNVNYYVLGLDGRTAGVTLKGGGRYAVADPEKGPRREELVPLFA